MRTAGQDGPQLPRALRAGGRPHGRVGGGRPSLPSPFPVLRGSSARVRTRSSVSIKNCVGAPMWSGSFRTKRRVSGQRARYSPSNMMSGKSSGATSVPGRRRSWRRGRMWTQPAPKLLTSADLYRLPLPWPESRSGGQVEVRNSTQLEYASARGDQEGLSWPIEGVRLRRSKRRS